MENPKGNCLGYIIVETDFDVPERKDVVYLETCPKYNSSNPKRTIKYIGETLLAFVVKIAQKNNKKFISIPIWSKTAENFYKENCGFEEKEACLYLYRELFDSFLSKNKKHTKSSILI